jgi:hypothetical protein
MFLPEWKAVALCIKRAKERGLKLPVAEEVTNEDLKALLHNSQERILIDPEYMIPDYSYIVQNLKKLHVTNGLLWTEYLVQCKFVPL